MGIALLTHTSTRLNKSNQTQVLRSYPRQPRDGPNGGIHLRFSYTRRTHMDCIVKRHACDLQRRDRTRPRFRTGVASLSFVGRWSGIFPCVRKQSPSLSMHTPLSRRYDNLRQGLSGTRPPPLLLTSVKRHEKKEADRRFAARKLESLLSSEWCFFAFLGFRTAPEIAKSSGRPPKL